jgi:acetolactate synthase small subunit
MLNSFAESADKMTTTVDKIEKSTKELSRSINKLVDVIQALQPQMSATSPVEKENISVKLQQQYKKRKVSKQQ